MPPFIGTVPAFHGIDGTGRPACAENYYHRKPENFFYNWTVQDLEKESRLAAQPIAILLVLEQPYSGSLPYESRSLNCFESGILSDAKTQLHPALLRPPMSIDIAGLMALGVLNLVLGLLIAFDCFRLSTLNKLIADVEKRISRLEILTNLAASNDSKVGQVIKRRAGGTL